jgi:hypothetical protein
MRPVSAHSTHDAGAAATAASLPPLRHAPLAIGWSLFWLLMLTISLHDHLRSRPAAPWWLPLVWDGSSCLVATVILAWQWRRLPRLDDRLHSPRRWFGAVLWGLPLWAPLFVSLVYALRHALYALAGAEYRHEPWAAVYRYEMLKFALFYGLFAAVGFGLRAHAAMLAERLRAERQLALTRQAQLTQLAQQIQPHFLFNALNTIAATVHTQPALADTLLTRLAALLRAATDLARQPEVTLDEELGLARAYAQIMAERFGERLQVDWQLSPQAFGCRVPTLSLQPLLENAFHHGVEAVPGKVSVAIHADCLAGQLRLEVHDDARSLKPDWSPGVGIGNLRERLAGLHGAAASLELARSPSGGTCVRMLLPCRH